MKTLNGASYITSKFVGDGWLIRIQDEDGLIAEYKSIVEPVMIGDAKYTEMEPPRPTKQYESKEIQNHGKDSTIARS